MTKHAIPVDLYNPGQVFACLGFLEAAEVLLGNAKGGFDWKEKAREYFCLDADGDTNPFAAVLRFLCADTTIIEWISPSPSMQERDGGRTIIRKNVSSAPEPKAPDLPAQVSGLFAGRVRVIPFGFWADGSTRFHTSFKKSTNGASSHIRYRNALVAIRELDFQSAVDDPLGQKARTESLFRIDPRGSADPINAGTSPDTLRKGGINVRVATYPICEALAVLGLENARPKRLWDRKSESFTYHAWGGLRSSEKEQPVLLPPMLARAALNGTFPFLSARRFCVEHEETKKGGDRKMISTTEEPNL